MTSTQKRPTLMYVLGLSPIKIGGMERFLRELAVQLTSNGWDCVFCFDGEISSEFRSYMQRDRVYLERVDGQQNLGIQAAPALWHLLRRYKPQVFVYAFHGVMRCFPWLARLSGCKSIYFNDHSSRAPQFVPGPLNLKKRIAGRGLTLPLRGIISVSEFTRRSGASLGLCAAPAVVIPNGVDVRARDANRAAIFREKWGIPQDAVLVTLAAWMVPVKGVDIALEAAKILLERLPETRVVFAGEGAHLDSYRYAVVRLGIEHAVSFAGRMNNPMEEGLFDATDLYLQPSLWQEAAPLAIIEAMSVGSPVVASKAGGIPELIEDGVTGYLVPPGDAAILAAKMEELVSSSALRRSMGDKARQAVVRRHQLHDVARHYVSLFLQQRSIHVGQDAFARPPEAPSGLRT